MWESVWGERGKFGAWGEVRKEVGKGMGVWGKVRGDMEGVKKCGGRCGRVYGGECGKVLWGVGIDAGRGMGVVEKGIFGV